MKRIFASRRTRWAALVVLLVLPALLAAYSVFEIRRPNSFGEDQNILNFIANNSDWLLGILFLALSAIPFFLVFERRRPQARELVPIAVMSAIAVVGRTVFSIVPLPNFKPCSAIIMITAIVFGHETGVREQLHLRAGTVDAVANVYLGAARVSDRAYEKRGAVSNRGAYHSPPEAALHEP